MKAIQIASDNSLVWAEFDKPAPGDHEVLIKVAATAINRADLVQRTGGYPPPPGASPILGLECAGEVVAVGASCQRYREGDRVCALLAGGGYAEYAAVDEGSVLPVPDGLTLTQAAGIPEVFATAWLNLFMEAGLQPGEKTYRGHIQMVPDRRRDTASSWSGRLMTDRKLWNWPLVCGRRWW